MARDSSTTAQDKATTTSKNRLFFSFFVLFIINGNNYIAYLLKSFMKLKWVLLICIVILVILVIGAHYHVAQKSKAKAITGAAVVDTPIAANLSANQSLPNSSILSTKINKTPERKETNNNSKKPPQKAPNQTQDSNGVGQNKTPDESKQGSESPKDTPLDESFNQTQITPNTSKRTITLANWNLQIFGDAKASKSNLMEFYLKAIKQFDVLFLQEIRDIDGSSFNLLCAQLADYNCHISSRAGTTSSKEQYGIVVHKNITVTETIDFNPQYQNIFERPPIQVTFQIENYSFSVYNIHIDPDYVQEELEALEQIIATTGNIILAGDLNADCSYYNPEHELEFDAWNWIINDEQDTTVAATNCAYDRFIVNNEAFSEIQSHGILKEGISKEVSDHYLIWLEIITQD